MAAVALSVLATEAVAGASLVTLAELVARVRRVLRRIGDFSYALEPRIKIDDRLEVEFALQAVVLRNR